MVPIQPILAGGFFLSLIVSALGDAQYFNGAPGQIPSGLFTCPSSGYQVPPEAMCNGRVDCPGGEDEANCQGAQQQQPFQDYRAPQQQQEMVRERATAKESHNNYDTSFLNEMAILNFDSNVSGY